MAMDGEIPSPVPQAQYVWTRHHYGMVARWIKEVALLFLASLVVQKLFAGGSIADPVVIVGAAASAILYGFAVHLLLKS